MLWTDDKISDLKRLWAEGETAQAIAAAMGDGCTRGAVIGKSRRLGLGRHRSAPPPRKRGGARKPVAGASTRKSVKGVSQPPLRRGEISPSLAAYEAKRRKNGAVAMLYRPALRCEWFLHGEAGMDGLQCAAPYGPHVAEAGCYCERHQFEAVHPTRRARLFAYSEAAE